jgi:hypothetical protein
LKGDKHATLRREFFAGPKMMDVTSKVDYFVRQMLAARKQKKKIASKFISTQEQTLRDSKGVTQVRPLHLQQHQDGQAHASIEKIDEFTHVIGHIQGARLVKVFQRTSYAHLR